MRIRRKDKAMAPQVETVELPDIIEPVQETDGWMFPRDWSDEDKRDWLVTHPEVRPQVETLNIDPDLGGGETGTAGEPTEWSEAEVISALKADGTYAAAIAVPPELAETVNSDNYDPRQFFLVHAEVWNEMVSAIQSEATLGLENRELRKQLNAQKRGMRRVNKHWSETKRQLRREQIERKKDNAASDAWDLRIAHQHREDRKRADIFATRLARRLRKARAGRDKRERQLKMTNEYAKGLARIVEKQDDYIAHLENLLTGGPLPTEGRTQL